ncbi:MAG: hypothetical protein IIT48_01570, partial [Lachnospiraceae bacterium]|nr:hypothetical protein [Lachnospiraceae bacterium]
RVPEKYVVHSGDILFAWSATLMVKIWDSESGWLNQHIFKVIPTKTIKIACSGGAVTVTNGDGGNFDKILQTVLKGTNTKSKVNPSNTKIQFTIGGSVSGGYEVSGLKFTS